MTTHWKNPYERAIPVSLEELASCLRHLGQSCRDVDGSVFKITEKTEIDHWRTYGEKLDAYVLPMRSPDDYPSIGVRYGAEDHEYISPAGDSEKVWALLQKHRTSP